jgi:hypothetical protein
MSNTPVSRSERIIDQVLAEAGLEDADDLRPVLLELRALTGDQPKPSPEVLALMSGASGAVVGHTQTGHTVTTHTPTVTGHAATDDAAAGDADAGDADTTVVDLAARRRNKRRLPLTALGVAVALAAGGGAAAAADQGVRDTLHEAFSSIAATFGGSQGQPDQDVTTSGQSEGTFQGTPPAPAHPTPSTTPDSGSPADGQRQDNQATPGAEDTGRSGSQWLNKNTPSIPGTGAGTPTELPVPEVTAPVPLPSMPNLPSSQRGDAPEPQP